MDFEQLLHRAAQRLLPQRGNGGYPPMLVHYCRHPPLVLREDGSPQLPKRADPRLLDAARRLGPLVDFLVITSNGTHIFQAEIEEAAGRKVLSMIEQTLAEVARRGWRKVGVLGMGEPIVYTRPLREREIDCQIIDAEQRATLDQALLSVMEGRDDDRQCAVAHDAVNILRAHRVDGIILGCTELPFLLRKEAEAPSLINPLPLLAEAAVRYAMA
jgi:aspartate racemase